MKKIKVLQQSSRSKADENFQTGTLKAQLSVLLIKNEITYQTSFSEIQQVLLSRFNVEYHLSQIEDELFCMKVEDEYADIVEEEEDFFDGY